MIKRYLYILFILVVITGCNKAQQLTSPDPVAAGMLKGIISPKIQATILVYQGDTKIQEIASDPEYGSFNISDLTPNEYTLQITAPNYQPAQVRVNIIEGIVSCFTVSLIPIPSADPDLDPEPEDELSFAAGEILVWFKDKVTLEEAQAIVSSFGVTGSFRDVDWKMFSFHLKVNAGDVERVITKLKESGLVTWAEERGGINNIIVQFNLKATEESARNLVYSIGNIEIVSVDGYFKWAKVCVPAGEEQFYINRFQTNENIKYAQLNFLIHLCNVL